MPFLAQIRSVLLRVRMVGNAAGFTCIIFCHARSPNASGVGRAWLCRSGDLFNRVVQRALRSSSHMSLDSSLSAIAAAFAADALETLALGRNPRSYIFALVVGRYCGRSHARGLRHLLLDLSG